jgi:hypothetical protein
MMSAPIELDATNLMRQACITAHDYMLNAQRDIEEIHLHWGVIDGRASPQLYLVGEGTADRGLSEYRQPTAYSFLLSVL